MAAATKMLGLRTATGLSSRFFSNSSRMFSNSFSTSQPPVEKTPMELIAEVPPKEVSGRVAACDGGGGSLGHPIEYITLTSPVANECKYCGLRFVQKKGKHH
mmetsp:Transcript_23361/g.38430  ORF Transcript_23361/g.38430 Transcript_23361/m.38430 type:complete len:102 (-) Transcript_23361:66-371(-)|eukprot:CAMPEP_0184653852 /NCGR_PEP_ID=MMETSP0308-20130426/11554_1 /TAXON_ID=38269 /ORGANISM="Gloeochaete witrockiana, Strain SAG 46.84" /LENGTH=101 /DNA_ID=CAMNT_0027089515 /DNA_START=36 /DNA_END=341 /DNA_ORIENTATION=-